MWLVAPDWTADSLLSLQKVLLGQHCVRGANANTCETRGMSSDYEDESRRAEYVTVQTASIVGKKVEDCFWDSETPDF